jgi:hypothetical protein
MGRLAVPMSTIRIGRSSHKLNSEMEPEKLQDLAVFSVHRALHWEAGSEEKALQKYPGLNREDLAAVEAHVIGCIRSRTRDEITGRPTLSKSLLKDGAYYKGCCRNATVARWNEAEQRFYHWREKFGNIFIETIKYPTDEEEPWWDVFFVVEELEAVKFEIPFDDNATFEGDPSALDEFQDEMWRRSDKHREDLKQLRSDQACSNAMTIE